MMYWIIFALFTCVETFADIFVSFWLVSLNYNFSVLISKLFFNVTRDSFNIICILLFVSQSTKTKTYLFVQTCAIKSKYSPLFLKKVISEKDNTNISQLEIVSIVN